VPKLTNEDFNLAKRFTLFIDEAYENKVALIILAQTSPGKIYETGINSELFKRTISRIREIGSDKYWKESKFFN
jgi:cell division protein ZapE